MTTRSSGQTDDHHRNPNVNNRDHLIGQLTNDNDNDVGGDGQACFKFFKSDPKFD